MASATKSVASRIEWCRRQKTPTCSQLEFEGWEAEEVGLRDALFNRDRTTQYQQRRPGVFERYAMGLQDGRSMLRVAEALQQFAPPTRRATHGLGNVNMLGRTRHVKK